MVVGLPFAAEDADLAGGDTLKLGMRAPEAYRGDTARALADTKGWIADGWHTVYLTEGHGPAARTVEVLGGEGIAARLEADLPSLEPGVVHVSCGSLDNGFVDPALRLAVLTETDLTGQRTATKDLGRMPTRRRKSVDPLTLEVGDYIVHEQHGVGRYIEMVQRTVQGATREYLLVEYAPAKRGQPGDRLYIPTDQLEQVTKYVGGEAPTLHRLGGADWTKTKARAKKAVKEIAADLIKLYSARMAAPGHTFGPDTPWQRELEDAFPYAETPDQLTTIAEVKEDMEKSVPMDRLICGDVGYGKTEIAVRAAFKAVQDGKQVAVLVPTTLLVQQHFGTFSERYAQFPVNVRALSRFQSDTESKATLEGLKEGSVDIVIGTHRLFSQETKFKDLGLVIVDEEQRFGVEHKEQLKKLRANVDVLTMSATPIPRTLEMAVTGIREMSTITTPPEERHPVLTFVGPYEEKQIGAAVRRELLREGQCFYIHNRVESIDRAAARLREIVPEARIATAHGQMSEQALEQVVVDFWEKKFDVLVSTTIVESGIDISNANTLIVERGDNFGLSQLHQLRGRVGRGRERGYAYFLYPPEKPLTETAHERLATIAQHTEMGAGMYVAMKDLEIRGAGNLLGGEQSGHIAGVGFDLYIRMVGEAVADYRAAIEGGAEEEPPLEVKIELPVDAHVPHDYAPGERLRLQAYRSIASANSEADIKAVREELTDRYGKLPEPVENLLLVAGLRMLARACGVGDITLQGPNIRFGPVELRESQELRLKRLYPGTVLKPATSQVLVPRPKTARVGGKPLVGRELLAWTGSSSPPSSVRSRPGCISSDDDPFRRPALPGAAGPSGPAAASLGGGGRARAEGRVPGPGAAPLDPVPRRQRARRADVRGGRPAGLGRGPAVRLRRGGGGLGTAGGGQRPQAGGLGGRSVRRGGLLDGGARAGPRRRPARPGGPHRLGVRHLRRGRSGTPRPPAPGGQRGLLPRRGQERVRLRDDPARRAARVPPQRPPARAAGLRLTGRAGRAGLTGRAERTGRTVVRRPRPPGRRSSTCPGRRSPVGRPCRPGRRTPRTAPRLGCPR